MGIPIALAIATIHTFRKRQKHFLKNVELSTKRYHFTIADFSGKNFPQRIGFAHGASMSCEGAIPALLLISWIYVRIWVVQ